MENQVILQTNVSNNIIQLQNYKLMCALHGSPIPTGCLQPGYTSVTVVWILYWNHKAGGVKKGFKIPKKYNPVSHSRPVIGGTSHGAVPSRWAGAHHCKEPVHSNAELLS